MKLAKEKLLSVVFLVSVVALCPPNLFGEEKRPPEPGDTAPPLSVERWLQPESQAAADWTDLTGKIVVLEFWATWCAPCVAAIPHWNELADKFRDRPVVFISVTDEEEKVIKEFLAATPLRGWVGLDTDDSLFDAYGVQGIPHTVLVNQAGKLIAVTDPQHITESVLHDALAGKRDAVRAALPEPLSVEPLVLQRSGGAPAPLLEILIRPSESPASMARFSANKATARGFRLEQIIRWAYQVSDARSVLPEELPDEPYDVQLTLPPNHHLSMNQVLQQVLETAFGLRARRETREVEVLLLTVPEGKEPALSDPLPGARVLWSQRGQMDARNTSLARLANLLEKALGRPVLNETGIEGKHSFQLSWDPENPDSLFPALPEQLGLELRPAIRPIEFLVLEIDEKSMASQ